MFRCSRWIGTSPGLGKTKLSTKSMDKIRDVLSSIMDSAVRYEFAG